MNRPDEIAYLADAIYNETQDLIRTGVSDPEDIAAAINYCIYRSRKLASNDVLDIKRFQRREQHQGVRAVWKYFICCVCFDWWLVTGSFQLEVSAKKMIAAEGFRPQTQFRIADAYRYIVNTKLEQLES